MTGVRYLPRWELSGVTGSVVVVDVLRAFTTAAYAIAAGAKELWLVDSLDDAFAFKGAHPGSLAMGEQGGRRPQGFELSNSPVQVAAHDLTGKVIVQCTGAGTRGVVAASDADRLWAASLVCASATAAAVEAAGLGAPTYVITGRFPDQPDGRADDDLATAQLIERARIGAPLAIDATAASIAASREWEITRAVGAGHFEPDDLAYATAVDRFDFAMEVHRIDGGLCISGLAPRP